MLQSIRFTRSGITMAMMLALSMGLLPAASQAQDSHGRGHDRAGPGPGGGRGMVLDSRHHHDQYYPPRGLAVRSLPGGYRSVAYGRDHYYMRGGVWYRPYGGRFVVFAPPFGLVVPFLPDFYTTVWFGGAPYYYANDTYYLWNRSSGGYVVTQPPTQDADGGTPAPASAPSGASADDVFVYPRNGQSAEDQSRDRFECHQWAVTQTGFDPSEPGGGVPESLNNSKRADYRRAITACLEGRQYSVR